MRHLRILVAEDHPLMVEAIKEALGQSTDFEVVAATHSGSDVMPLVLRHLPDLVLLDLSLLQEDGLDVLRAIRASGVDTQVVVFSAHDGRSSIDAALKEGAAGFISKRIEPFDLAAALRQVLDPTLFMSQTNDGDLNDRELEVLRALLDGLSNKEISKRLWLTEQAVKARLTSLYAKLGVSSRTEAVAVAYAQGFKASGPAKQVPRRAADA
jgi:DNA-binding NarL/FixJ family response regulator